MKVMIGLPMYDPYQGHEFRDSLDRLMEYTIQKGIEVFASRYERIRIDIARDNAIREAIEHKADYLLFIDDDQVFAEDALVKLLKHKLDIVGGIIPRRNPPHVPCIFKYIKDSNYGAGYKPISKSEIDNKLFEVAAIGMGFTLISKECFTELYNKHLEAPFLFHAEDRVIDGKRQMLRIGEDIMFCRRAKRSGFKVWADPDIKPGHKLKAPHIAYNEDWELIYI